MMCEICGERVGALHEVIYRGKRGYVCDNCKNKYGLVKVRSANKPIIRRVESSRPKPVTLSVSKPKVKKDRSGYKRLFYNEFDYVEDFGEVIKKARESLGLTQIDLARELKVKLSYIKKIEASVLPPSYDVARNIERILNIKIIKKVEDEEEPIYKEDVEDFSLTLGDLLRFEEGNE